jgi:energy-coupling factor transport system permease protein
VRRLVPAAPTAYHRLNPLTKATAAATVALGAFLVGGYLAPAALLATLVIPGAVAARLLAKLAGLATAVTLPIAVSVALVSTFTRPGATVLFEVGPFDATLEGVDFAAQAILRLFAMAAALVLFGLTTESRAFVADLERRGASPRLTFAAAATLETVPAIVERARAVRDAQRARGLDTEGSVLNRARGVLPLVGPVVLGSLHEVEARSLALEARAFGRPGPRHLLWAPSDSSVQRVARWALAALVVAIVVGTLTGVLPQLP